APPPPRAGTADQEGGNTVSVGVPDDAAAGASDPAAVGTVPRLRAEIVARAAVIPTLETRISQLDAQVIELQARLRANSSNSSKPPSADGLAKGPPRPDPAGRRAPPAPPQPPPADGLAKAPPRPDRAGRRAAPAATRRKPGGQPGAPGAHLAQVEHPDLVVGQAPQ